MTYSKSSKREKEGGIQNPAREREKEVFKIQQENCEVGGDDDDEEDEEDEEEYGESSV